VDGVLTDGRVYLDGRGHELKVFDTKDGQGIKMAIAAGIKIAWISGRVSPAVEHRARELGVRAVKQGVKDKNAAAGAYLARWKLAKGEAAACGDDSPDIGLFDACGFSACPADASADVRSRADLVLKSPGGRGAVREFVEEILRKNREENGPGAG
jgi:YrbI family 3-deoxy-D-manno-octulosonate 8-phosphate phosphatase